MVIERLEDRETPAIITVTDTGDTVAVDGLVTLREAILSANGDADVNADVVGAGAYGADVIQFAIPGAAPFIISPTSALPSLTDAAGVDIDGTSQPGFAGMPIIVVDGTGAGAVDGFSIVSSNNTIRGLVISNFNVSGIAITGAGATNNVVKGNYIGTDAAGTTAAGNGAGIVIDNNSSGNTIGGSTAGAGNLISGNTNNGVVLSGTNGNLVQGNFIGTDINGTAMLGNGTEGIRVENGAANNTIGGSTAGAGNLISGNNDDGIDIRDAGTSGNVVAGNLIGTDVNGTSKLGNADDGIQIQSGATGNTVGGTTTAERNVISGNGSDGVALTSGTTTGNVVLGNFIGTDKTGAASLGNAGNGVILNVNASNNTVGGTAAGSRNVISGNTQSGILITGNAATGNVVVGNFIGTDVNGTAALGNGIHGVDINNAPSNTIGTVIGSANVISGNTGDGVRIQGTAATGNVVQANLIGTDNTGNNALANGGDGVRVDGASGNTIGNIVDTDGNLISGNTLNGVRVTGAGATGNMIIGNFIGTDFGGNGVIANGLNGVAVEDAGSNTIGGSTGKDGNIISGNTGDGVLLTGAGATGNILIGNWIGINANGTGASANGGNGITVQSGAANNTVGGTTAGERNVISGNTLSGVRLTGTNTNGNLVRGNFIGTDVNGTAKLGNGVHGLEIVNQASNNTIGGTATGAGNLISGNTFEGVQINNANTTGNVLLGNRIGTNAAGSAALGNGRIGVVILGGAANNTIGGTAAGAGNLISGNGDTGVQIQDANTNGNLVRGNLIGTDFNGTAMVANGAHGVGIVGGAANNTIGGTAAGARNIISGNTNHGVAINVTNTSNNQVLGNFIGTDVNGTAAIGNGSDGVNIRGAASNNTIGGTAAGARNVISGNGYDGVSINEAGTSGNVVLGNFIGTDVNGTAKLGNAHNGAVIWKGATANTIGGTAAGAGNVVSGNAFAGVAIVESGTNGNLVQGNFIGTDVNGTAAIGNTIVGVFIGEGGASANTIGGLAAGAENTIAFNAGNGVAVGTSAAETTAVGNAILINRIFRNGGLGIDLGSDGKTNNDVLDADTGPNALQNRPALTGITLAGTNATVNGILKSTPSSNFRIQFFRNSVGFPAQAEIFAGEQLVTTDANGDASYSIVINGVNPTDIFSATATNTATNNTSEIGFLVPSITVVGAGAGGGPHVKVFEALTGNLKFSFFAFGSEYTGGVRVADGDVNGDGIPDIIAATGPGQSPRVTVFDGTNLNVIRDFYAYDVGFRGGLFVTSADINNDGFADIITGAGAGGGPHVRIWSGQTGAELGGFFAYGMAFQGGVTVAAGDLDNDENSEIFTGAGFGGGPHVRVWNPMTATERFGFFAESPGFLGGVTVTGGDLNGDGMSEIIVGFGAGMAPTVRIFGPTGAFLQSFFAFGAGFPGGVNVASVDANDDGNADIITGAGPGGGPHARIFRGDTLGEIRSSFVFDVMFLGGVFVG